MKSFVLHKARLCAKINGRDCLQKDGKQICIIISGLNELIEKSRENFPEYKNKNYNINTEDNDFYSLIESIIDKECPEISNLVSRYNVALIFKNPKIIDHLKKELDSIYINFGQKKYDISMDNDEKKQILQNTITAFSKEFQLLKDGVDYDEYEKFIQKNIESRSAKKATTGKSKFEHFSIDFILASMERKISDEKELKLILSSLVLIDANFYIKYDNINIYPAILDLLVDTVSIDYQFYLDKELIQTIIKEWKNANKAQKLRAFFSKLQFNKMEWIEQITYSLSRSYLLHEYIKTLEQDPKKIQNFFQNILYNNIEHSKHTPRLPPEHFDKIAPRRFFLENTKMVLGKR